MQLLVQLTNSKSAYPTVPKLRYQELKRGDAQLTYKESNIANSERLFSESTNRDQCSCFQTRTQMSKGLGQESVILCAAMLD